jgi:hypothetical protein
MCAWVSLNLSREFKIYRSYGSSRCIVKDRENNSHHVVSDSRLITVQIDELFGEFVSVEVATIGYVAAILLVQIEEEEVDSVKFKFPGG